MIEIIPKLFLICSICLFISFLLILVDYRHKWRIGIILFLIVVISVIANHFEILSVISVVFSPFIIFLDYKRLGVKKCLIYLILTFITILVFKKIILMNVPFFLIPILVFSYVILQNRFSEMRKRMKHE